MPAESTELKKQVSDKSKKLWGCLAALSSHYQDVELSKISINSKFHDDVWINTEDSAFNINWQKWLPASRHYPLQLFCRVAVYYQIQLANRKVSSVQPSIRAFISAFLDLLEAKSILIAEPENQFNNFSHLENEDIVLVLQKKIAETGSFNSNIGLGMNYLFRCPMIIFPYTEFLIGNFKTPWDQQKVSSFDWVEKFKKEHNANKPVRAYPPLDQKVVDALVQACLPFINEYFDLIKAVFDELENTNKPYEKNPSHRIRDHIRAGIYEKYGEQLDSIYRLKLTKSGRNKQGISLRWFGEFEYLVQGAAAWIILLTTGLRNHDMRNLTKACCQPSKRFDLLYYLITDIKKTDLKNYIIPVPEAVFKATKLAELAKLDRSGTMLITQRAHSSRSSLEDKKRIGSNGTFNKLIRSFAANYNIKLNTISDDVEATAHCVRATLAGYIGANSHVAIIILKRLFGHSNNLMPDAYLANNPIIIRQRKENITKAQDQQAGLMAKAWVNGKVTATKGKQLLQGIKHVDRELREELKNESLTEMDFHVRLEQRLKEILLERIRGDDIYALKTPVGVICMRSVSDSTDSPCAKQINHQRRKELNISKDVTDALATLPNPAHCIGKDCSDALMGEPWSRDLLLSFDYYIKLLKGQGHKNLDIVNMAKHYVKVYGPLLKDLYETEREAGYFDQ